MDKDRDMNRDSEREKDRDHEAPMHIAISSISFEDTESMKRLFVSKIQDIIF
jgi:hypothetical protein